MHIADGAAYFLVMLVQLERLEVLLKNKLAEPKRAVQFPGTISQESVPGNYYMKSL
jgi:hypothetical protein